MTGRNSSNARREEAGNRAIDAWDLIRMSAPAVEQTDTLCPKPTPRGSVGLREDDQGVLFDA